MAGLETLLGVDIGTTKVAAVIGGRGPGVVLLGAASVPCKGLKRGAVVDVEETTRAIRKAVSQAQRTAGRAPDTAWVGITGQHISCLNTRAEIPIARTNRQLTWEDVERVIDAAVRAVSIPADRRMIHAISRGFTVDDEPRVRNPIGLSASRLAVEAHIVTASRNIVENITLCVDRSGLGLAELVAEPLAAADAVLTEEEEEVGALLVDIGGGTTDLALFLDGSIAFTGAVPAAGTHVTHDLAVALEMTHPQAEQIKLIHGCALSSLISEEDSFSIIEEGTERSLSRRLVAEVIEARTAETFQLVARELSRLGSQWRPPGGVVLCGGGSLLPGIAALAEETLECRCRLGRPRVASGPIELLESPALATGVGLVYYAHQEAESRRTEQKLPVRVLPILGRVVAWVRELLRS